MTIGEKVVTARKEAGLTQKELAAAVGITEGSVQQYEAGRMEPRSRRLRAIAEATGKPLSYFLGESEGSSEVITIDIGGTPITGPRDVLEKIRVGQQAQQDYAIAGAMSEEAEGTDPQSPHPGIQEFLGLHRSGQLRDRFGFEITEEEARDLADVGFSGNIVSTVEQAIDLVLMWRDWALKRRLQDARREQDERERGG